MDKELKRIINYLKREVNEPLQVLENEVDTSILINIKDCKQLLKFINKQQKEIKELKQFKKEVIEIIKYADDTAEPTYWNIRKLLKLGE